MSQEPGAISKVLVGSVASVIVVGVIVGVVMNRSSSGTDARSPVKHASICADEPPTTRPAKVLRTKPYEDDIDAAATYTVRIGTSCGDLFLKLSPEEAPIAVNNFVALSRAKWFNGTYFHGGLNQPGVIEAGDATGRGDSGPGYTIETDPPSDHPYEVGSIGMVADAGPDSAGSRFFIIVDERGLDLPTGYTVFGHLVGESSLEVAKRIASVPVPAALTPPIDTASALQERVWLLGVRINEKVR